MATYIMLNQWTAEGIENVSKSPDRIDKAREEAKEVGCEVKAVYGLMGHKYDTVLIIEAPNDTAIARYALRIGKQGNVRTETVRAFAELEFRSLIESL